MIKYPLSFYTHSKSLFGIQTPWPIESQNITNPCAIPPEFEGPGGGLSPEDLFAQALTNCFVATFKVYAEKSKVSFKEVVVQSELIVDMDSLQKPVMKKCLLNIKIYGAANPDRLKTIAEKALQSGFILNSVKTEISSNIEFFD
ncbi:MAG: OsmC family protein [Pseudobdellovibrionaceae bacterium]